MEQQSNEQALQPVYPTNKQTVFAVEDSEAAHYGGGAHLYRIENCLGFSNGETQYGGGDQSIQFVMKDAEGNVTPGLQSEQLLLLLGDRHEKLNSRFPAATHAKFMAGIQMALDACRERIDERMERKVMGELKQ